MNFLEKVTTKEKPRTKHNINPNNLSAGEKVSNEKSKKSGTSKDLKTHNQWGIPEEETLVENTSGHEGIF